MDEKVSTGCKAFDVLLDGGLETGVISTVYGPAGSGKTTFCQLCSMQHLKHDKKVLFVDTEGGFSLTRFSQINSEYEKYLESLIILKPTTFKQQEEAITKLASMSKHNVGIIIIDTIASLYRVEFSDSTDKNEMIKKLSRQLNVLNRIAREENIPILITNQVYASFEDKNSVRMVGGDILNYASKALIEIQKTKTKRRAILKKHRSLPENRETIFKIVQGGFAICE